MNDLAFTDPDRKRYFEDYIPGKLRTGQRHHRSEEMLAWVNHMILKTSILTPRERMPDHSGV